MFDDILVSLSGTGSKWNEAAGADQRVYHDNDGHEGGPVTQDLRPHPATQGRIQGQRLVQVR